MNSRFALLAGAVFTIIFASIARSQDRPAQVPDTLQEPSVRPGFNRDFLSPELDVQSWVQRFELESREIFAARRNVLAACQVRPEMRVADIGAGSGFYSRLFAAAVGPTGWVYAVDVAPAFVAHIAQQADAERVTNLTAVRCSERSITLPPASIDLAFVCDTYHHFEYPQSTLASIHRALSENGQLVIIDFERVAGQSRDWVLEHVRAGKDEFRQEIEAAGFTFVDEVKIAGFRENYLLRFKKQAQASPALAQSWKRLFNGKDLDGFDTYLGRPERTVEGLDLPKNARGNYSEPVGLNKDPTKVFTIVEMDGAPAIRVSGQILGAFTTRDEYENYHLRFQVKWGEKRWPPRDQTVRDSGVLYHCVGPHGAGSGAWMQSVESQIQENDFGDFWSVAGVIVDVEGDRQGDRGPLTFKKGGQLFPGWRDRIVRNPLSEKEFGQWNTVEIYAVGQTGAHVNNGKTNMILTNIRRRVDGQETPLTKGKIQFQSEYAEVYYRNIDIRPIDRIPDAVLLK